MNHSALGFPDPACNVFWKNSQRREAQTCAHSSCWFILSPSPQARATAESVLVSRGIFFLAPFSPRMAPLLHLRLSVHLHDLRSQTPGNDSPRLRKLPGPHVASCSGFSFQFFLQLWTLGIFLPSLQAELGIKRTLGIFYLTLEMVIAHRRYSDLKSNIARARNRFFQSSRLSWLC